MRWAKPSTMAVLPTPDSPIRTGLFFVRRLKIWSTRSISSDRPMTGSNWPSWASCVRSRPNSSKAGVLLLRSRSRGADFRRKVTVSCRAVSRLAPRLRRILPPIPSSSRKRPRSRCSLPMWLCPSRRASSTAYSMTFFTRGLKGISPNVIVVPPPGKFRSISKRICSEESPIFLMIIRAIPSDSRRMAKTRCSVPR